jgi:CRP-like cAMP-binding protein
MAQATPKSVQNRLLAALPPADLARLRSHLKRVSLPLRKVLSKARSPIEHAYFLESGVVSLVVQLADGWAIEAGVVGQATRSSALSGLLLRFNHALHIHVIQTAACNGRHTVKERLARWLLVTHDRVEANALPFTQDLLSVMLGARRPGVTVALGSLKASGIVRNAPGRITILDREALEAASCECYRAVRDEYERLLPMQDAARTRPSARLRSS